MAYTFKHGDRPLEGYTIQRGIGRGGFGEVYYAVSDGGREVALKYLRDNSDVELRGVSHCINLKSPYLVSIFDVKKNADGEYFIIMEHIAGPALSELLIAEPNGLGKEKAAFFLREIGRGLADLHDRGIVHRDMKPANIFYEDGHVKIGDYGLSKFISVSRHSAQTTSIGTVHYMAPEVGSGNYHRGIDIYALGVILYEMLLGRVPFEGSSMGEVLMKHLTEQPEIEGLPEPFGKVIRKALEKDPKDRYQDVNEMVDDMLEVGDIRNSLAGFNPNTITVAPRRSGQEPMRTPVPSPNPAIPRAIPPVPPPPANPADDIYVGRYPKQVEKRIHRINDKVARKMDKLAGRPHRRRRQPPIGAPHGTPALASANNTSWFQRAVLSVVITLGICVGMGLILAVNSGEELVGVSTGLMIFSAAAGVRISRRALGWLGSAAQPGWVEKLVTVGCCALPMTLACLPLTDAYEERAFAFLVGMLATILFSDIHGRIEAGSRGELSFGRAFSLGLFGAIACAVTASIFDARSDESFALMGAGTAGALSLLLEALAWCRPAVERGGVQPSGGDYAQPPAIHGEGMSAAPPIDPSIAHEYRDAPFAIPVHPGTQPSGYVSDVPLPPERSMVARGFWSIFAFLSLGGVILCILFGALDTPECDDDMMGLVVGAVACGSLMLFAAQKLTTRKRIGFWKETFCPLLIVAATTGLGACIAFLVIKDPGDGDFAGAVSGIVMLSIVLLALLMSRVGLLAWIFGSGNKTAKNRPFVLGAAVLGGDCCDGVDPGRTVDVSYPGLSEERNA